MSRFLDIITSEVSEKRRSQRIYKGQFDEIHLNLFDSERVLLEIEDISYTGVRFCTPAHWQRTVVAGEEMTLQLEIEGEHYPILVKIVNVYPTTISAIILDRPKGSRAYFEKIFIKLVATSLSQKCPPGRKGIRYFEGANGSFACIEKGNKVISFFCFGFMSSYFQYRQGVISTGRVSRAYVSTNNITIENPEDVIELDKEVNESVIQTLMDIVKHMNGISEDEKKELIILTSGDKL